MKYCEFGRLATGEAVMAYTLENSENMSVTILNYGGIIQSMRVPAGGERRNIVLGYDTLEDYLENPAYLGAIIGRTAGRLNRGQLVLQDKTYQLNDDQSPLLHGGPKGFHQQLMTAQGVDTPEGEKLVLTFKAESEIDGYPGDVMMEISYLLLRHENRLILGLKGQTTMPTYLNVTQHSYFNLSKDQQTSVEQHRLRMNADAYAPVDSNTLPANYWADVKDTVMDYQKEKNVERGIDHPFRLMKKSGNRLFAARLVAPDEALVLAVYTSQPHMVVYTGNFLDVAHVPSQKKFSKYQGICFETQEKPNLINMALDQCQLTTPSSPYDERIEYVVSPLL